MRGLLLAGLALGTLALSVHAQDVHWRPAGAGQSASPAFQTIRMQNGEPGFATVKSRVGLMRPVSVQGSSAPPAGPVVFRPVEARSEENYIKIKYISNDPQPMSTGTEIRELPPVGELIGVQNAKPMETLPTPKNSPTPRLVPVPAGSTSEPSKEGMVQGLPEGEYLVEGGSCVRCGIMDGDGCWTSRFWGGTSSCSVPRLYGSAEFLLWAIKDPSLPPVATGTTLSMPQIIALAPQGIRPGAIGQLGTQTLFGGDDLDSPMFAGGRFTLGFSRLCSDIGIEGTFFFLGENGNDFFARSSPANPFLFVPFFDTNPRSVGENALAVGSPGVTGVIAAQHSTRLWGMEANLRKPWWCDCESKLDLLGGFRFIELAESFDLECNCFTTGTNMLSMDSFGTRNRFYGGQIGADYESRHGRWILGATGKIALGAMYQSVRIDGFSFETNAAGMTRQKAGSFFTAPSNIGKYYQDDFAVVPELQVKVGYQITDNISAFVGYNFLYMSTVARPGDQIDRSFDPRAGGQGPIFVYQDTDFWTHGVNFGLNWRY